MVAVVLRLDRSIVVFLTAFIAPFRTVRTRPLEVVLAQFFQDLCLKCVVSSAVGSQPSSSVRKARAMAIAYFILGVSCTKNSVGGSETKAWIFDRHVALEGNIIALCCLTPLKILSACTHVRYVF